MPFVQDHVRVKQKCVPIKIILKLLLIMKIKYNHIIYDMILLNFNLFE